MSLPPAPYLCFFFNDTATTEIYTLSLHDALPIFTLSASFVDDLGADSLDRVELVMALEEAFDLEIPDEEAEKIRTVRSEEHTSELQSRVDLVCRLLLEKKKQDKP